MQPAPSVKIGWKIMLAHGIYIAGIGLLMIFLAKTMFVPTFTSFTAQSWSDFLVANPKPAELFIITERALGAMVLSAGLFIALVASESYRKAEKWSWYTLLIISILGWGTWLAYHISAGDLKGLVAVYIGIVLFVIGIALPARAILGEKAAGK